MNPWLNHMQKMTRRQLFQQAGMGMGGAALGSLLGEKGRGRIEHFRDLDASFARLGPTHVFGQGRDGDDGSVLSTRLGVGGVARSTQR